MKKRILAMMLASAMVVGLVGCGGNSDSKDTKEETKTDDTEENTEYDVSMFTSIDADRVVRPARAR